MLATADEDLPAWMLGMQDDLKASANARVDAPKKKEKVRRKSITKASQDTKEAMAYARSLGAFMSPDDAKILMTSVQVDRKVLLDCVVTTDKGPKDAKVEITPELVRIYGRGMFSTKTLFKFAMASSLKVKEAPTPKLLMLMGAPELNGEMLYINCDKRGVFAGAVAAFLKEQTEAAAEAGGGDGGGGGDDGWGSSGW